MSARANISPGYRWRLALVSFFCFGLAGWALYDGSIGYPAQQERARTYHRLAKEKKYDEWKALAQERGWSDDDPGEAYSDEDIVVQFIMAGIVAPVGLLFLIFFVMTRGRWIEADEGGIRTSWGQQLQFDELTGLNKKKWRKKGIAIVLYEQDGRKRRLKLDDCHYDPEPTEEILGLVASRLSEDQIIEDRPKRIIIDDEPEEETEDADAGQEAGEADEATDEPPAEDVQPASQAEEGKR